MHRQESETSEYALLIPFQRAWLDTLVLEMCFLGGPRRGPVCLTRHLHLGAADWRRQHGSNR
eukprot:8218605-Pyramimonas_sp.AAC.1